MNQNGFLLSSRNSILAISSCIIGFIAILLPWYSSSKKIDEILVEKTYFSPFEGWVYEVFTENPNYPEPNFLYMEFWIFMVLNSVIISILIYYMFRQNSIVKGIQIDERDSLNTQNNKKTIFWLIGLSLFFDIALLFQFLVFLVINGFFIPVISIEESVMIDEIVYIVTSTSSCSFGVVLIFVSTVMHIYVLSHLGVNDVIRIGNQNKMKDTLNCFEEPYIGRDIKNTGSVTRESYDINEMIFDMEGF